MFTFINANIEVVIHYKREYCRIALGSYFVSYFYGNHEHENPANKDDHRGLTGSQKIIIQEAMNNKRKSAKETLHYFRSKRTKILDELSLHDFPQVPNIIKLNNYIQSFKKKNAKSYNPTPTDVKNWCDSHGPSTVDIYDDKTFNTPFVLGHIMVSGVK